MGLREAQQGRPGASWKPAKPHAVLIPLRQALNQQGRFSLQCSRAHVNLHRDLGGVS